MAIYFIYRDSTKITHKFLIWMIRTKQLKVANVWIYFFEAHVHVKNICCIFAVRTPKCLFHETPQQDKQFVLPIN